LKNTPFSTGNGRVLYPLCRLHSGKQACRLILRSTVILRQNSGSGPSYHRSCRV
jgi:hypothetical protein